MVEEKQERDEFIKDNLLLVHSLCRRFSGRGIEYDDLYQAGCVGLVKAVDAFDSSRGLCFSTYAVPVILGEIKRLFRDGGSVKVSRGLKELCLKLSRVKNQMEFDLGREPTVNELAQKLEVSPEEVTEAVCASMPTVSLTCSDDERSAEIDVPVLDSGETLDNKIVLDEAFKYLDEKEKKLIKYRYFDYYTQNETAKALSMTQVQVSRAEKKILLKMRGIIDKPSRKIV